MMSYIRDLRLIPIAVIACASLFALKAADLLLDGGFVTVDVQEGGLIDGASAEDRRSA